MNNSAKQYHASVDLLQLFTVTLFRQSVSISLSVSSEFSFISVSSVKVVVSLTHAFGSCGGTSESCVVLAWSSDGMIVVRVLRGSCMVFGWHDRSSTGVVHSGG